MRIFVFGMFVIGSLLMVGCKAFHHDGLQAQDVKMTLAPRQIYHERGSFHVQGVAVDMERGYAYFSFTTSLVKTDLEGNLVGTVEGMTGHLGCIDINPDDGRIYGSLEYKNDVIGKGILKTLGNGAGKQPLNAFYIAVFDADKIIREGMNAETDGVLTTVYLRDVVEDYEAKVVNNGRVVEHRYGCSGIDGLAFGPQFGTNGGKNFLNVAYGIYDDTTRTDNDYQVILQYDVKKLKKYEQPLSQGNIHQSGPLKPLNKYFVFTGNTNWGIQNLAYDKNTGYWFAAVYPGQKRQYPNYSLFTIDGTVKPHIEMLKGFENGEKGQVLQLSENGIPHGSGILGWRHKDASTGIHALGNGFFFISQNGKTQDNMQYCRLQLCHWTGDIPDPFVFDQ